MPTHVQPLKSGCIAIGKRFEELGEGAVALPVRFVLSLHVVWLFLADPSGWQRLLRDADTTLHIRVGEQILSSGSIRQPTRLSFSKPGGTWYAFEWLSGSSTRLSL